MSANFAAIGVNGRRTGLRRPRRVPELKARKGAACCGDNAGHCGRLRVAAVTRRLTIGTRGSPLSLAQATLA